MIFIVSTSMNNLIFNHWLSSVLRILSLSTFNCVYKPNTHYSVLLFARTWTFPDSTSIYERFGSLVEILASKFSETCKHIHSHDFFEKLSTILEYPCETNYYAVLDLIPSRWLTMREIVSERERERMSFLREGTSENAQLAATLRNARSPGDEAIE